VGVIVVRSSLGGMIGFIASILLLHCQVVAHAAVGVSEAVSMRTHGLALFNSIQQENAASSDPSRTQFDAAVSFDLAWQLSQTTEICVQLQSGPGAGSLDLQGPEVVVTDLFIAHKVSAKGLTFTFGSYDLPFGYGVTELSNNGDASANRTLMNPLLYCVVGDPLGTNNTIGGKLEYIAPGFEAVFSLSNGTDESSSNRDGSFAGVIGFGSRNLPHATRAGIWFLHSDDNTSSGSEGIGATLSGALADIRTMIGDNLHLAGYAGVLRFADNQSGTRSDVPVWMVEPGYDRDVWSFTFRASGWMAPKSDSTANALLPNPGLAVDVGGGVVETGQSVIRYQLSVRRQLSATLSLRMEAIRDRYEISMPSGDSHVNALILAMSLTI